MKLFFCALLFTASANADALQIVPIGLASNFSELSTGSSNPFGNYFRDGVLLALDDSEIALKQKGLEVKFTEFDYGNSDRKAIVVANRAVESNVLAVIGYNYSSNALLAAQVHHDGGLPMITPSASANRLGEFGSYVHMGCFSNQFIAQTLANIAYDKLHARRALIFPAVDCAYCADLANEFDLAFKNKNGTTKQFPILVDDKNFSKVILKAKSESFDLVFVPDQEITSARLISALISAGIKTTYLGGDGWGDIVESFFGQLNSIPFKGFSVSHWNIGLKDRKSRDFASKYFKKFGKHPNDTSVLAYDATGLLIKAILTTHDLSRKGIESTLNSMRTYEGITGKSKLRANKAPIKNLVLLSTDGRKFKPVDIISPANL